MKNFSKISMWFGGSVVWSILFISLASYSAQKALETDANIEEKLSRHFSDKWGATINVSFDSDSSNQDQDEWTIKNSIQKINIETINGDIEIVTVPGAESVKVKASGKFNKNKAPRLLEVTDSEDRLLILQPDKGAVSSLQIKIEIPESYSGQLNLSTVSGDISANNFKPQSLILKSVSGNISFADLNSPDIQLKTVSGDVNLDNVLAQKLEAITTSGDVSIHFPGLQDDIKFDIQTVSGDINNLNNSTGKASRQYRVNTVSGDVEIR
jgi:DUF4097 and DUF4098 domain-containing protein YvlB